MGMQNAVAFRGQTWKQISPKETGLRIFQVRPRVNFFCIVPLLLLLAVHSACGQTINTQPQNQTVSVGSNVTFTVAASGSGTLTYQWQLNTTNISSATGSSFTIANAQPTNAGDYQVVVSNGSGSVTSSNATLSVGSAVAVTNFFLITMDDVLGRLDVNPTLNQIYLTTGGNSSYSALAIDGGTFAQRNVGAGFSASVDVSNNNYWCAELYSGNVIVRSGATDATVTTVQLSACPTETAVDAPHRRVWVATQCGGGNDPVYAINADTYAVQAGPIGSGGGLGDILVNPATDRAYIAVSGTSKRVDPSTFAVTANAFGFVVGANPQSDLLYAVTFSGVLQILNGAPDPEVILNSVTLPFAMGASQIGINTNLNRIYVGSSYADVVQILDASSGAILGAFALGNGLNISTIRVDPTRNRVYVTGNSAGGLGYLAVFQDNGGGTGPVQPLSINTQPQSQSVGVGSNVTFTVAASGSGVLSYQWQYYGTNIASATASSFTITGAQSINAGDYQVVVSNGSSNVTSASVALSVGSGQAVTNLPFITGTPTFGRLQVNPVLNQIYMAAGGNSSYQVIAVDGGTFAQRNVGEGFSAEVDATNNNYWSAELYLGTVVVRSGTTDGTLTTVQLSACPTETAVDAPHRRVWVAAQCGSSGGDPVWAINADTYAVQAGPIGSGGGWATSW